MFSFTNFDTFPENIQESIYKVFVSSTIKDKLIFLSKMKYGNDLSYRELSNIMGMTFQRVQQIYDSITKKIGNDQSISGCLINERKF